MGSPYLRRRTLFKSQIKGVVFDLDGTLVDSLATTFEAINQALVTFGSRAHTPAEILKYFGPGEGEIIARMLGVPQAPEAYRVFRDHLESNMDRVPLHAGVPELLEELKSRGVPIAIVTGRGWPTTEQILKHHRLLDRFVTVIASEHVASPKPSPEGIHLSLTRLQLAPEHAVYVGDSPSDMRAARLAGTGAIAALWDLMASREDLAFHQPHHFAERPAQVLELISRKA